MQSRIDEVDETLSARMISDTLEQGGTWGFGSFMALQHAEVYEQHVLSPETAAYFAQAAEQSLEKQAQLEQDCTLSFEEYLKNFR